MEIVVFSLPDVLAKDLLEVFGGVMLSESGWMKILPKN